MAIDPEQAIYYLIVDLPGVVFSNSVLLASNEISLLTIEHS